VRVARADHAGARVERGTAVARGPVRRRGTAWCPKAPGMASKANRVVRSVARVRCPGAASAIWNSSSRLRRTQMLRRAGSVSQNRCKQKPSTPRACLCSLRGAPYRPGHYLAGHNGSEPNTTWSTWQRPQGPRFCVHTTSGTPPAPRKEGGGTQSKWARVSEVSNPR
jgi:hypothetical protein